MIRNYPEIVRSLIIAAILEQKFRKLYHVKLGNIIFIVHLILHNITIDDRFDLVANDHLQPHNHREVNEENSEVSDEEDDQRVQDIKTRKANSLPM